MRCNIGKLLYKCQKCKDKVESLPKKCFAKILNTVLFPVHSTQYINILHVCVYTVQTLPYKFFKIVSKFAKYSTWATWGGAQGGGNPLTLSHHWERRHLSLPMTRVVVIVSPPFINVKPRTPNVNACIIQKLGTGTVVWCDESFHLNV